MFIVFIFHKTITQFSQYYHNTVVKSKCAGEDARAGVFAALGKRGNTSESATTEYVAVAKMDYTKLFSYSLTKVCDLHDCVNRISFLYGFFYAET